MLRRSWRAEVHSFPVLIICVSFIVTSGFAVQNCHTMPPLDQQIYLNHFNTPNLLAGLKQSMLPWSLDWGFPSPRRVPTIVDISDLRAFHFVLGQSYSLKDVSVTFRSFLLNLTLGPLVQTAITFQWWFQTESKLSSLRLCDDVLAWSRHGHFPGQTSPHPSLSKSGVQKLGREL